MSDVNLTLPNFCACQTGSVFVRRCGRPATAECGRCGLCLCEEHANRDPGDAGMAYCPDCQARSGAASANRRQGRGFSSDATGYHTGDRSFSGLGGGSWIDSDGDDGPSFADEDYAAFDALSDFDMKADGGHAYDS